MWHKETLKPLKTFLLKTKNRLKTAMIKTVATIKAGSKILRSRKVTVISLDVMGFLLGGGLSAVGRPFSILSSSEMTSSALE